MDGVIKINFRPGIAAHACNSKIGEPKVQGHPCLHSKCENRLHETVPKIKFRLYLGRHKFQMSDDYVPVCVRCCSVVLINTTAEATDRGIRLDGVNRKCEFTSLMWLSGMKGEERHEAERTELVRGACSLCWQDHASSHPRPHQFPP